MDNLSHSVVGLAIGEYVHRRVAAEPDPENQSLRRRLFLASGWFASNCPDLDIVLTPLLPPPLGYLLHHRGHTHTLAYALPQAVLVCALIWFFWPSARRLLKQSPSARAGFAVTVVAGFALHLLMDYLNSYGIHPFHPYDSRWVFGDMVFILEPVFWVAFGAPLVVMVVHRPLRILLIVLLVGIPVFFAFLGFLSLASVALLALICLAAGTAQHYAGSRGTTALTLAALMTMAFVGTQSLASAKARHIVEQNLHSKDPDSDVLDAAMTAFPTNPVCWSFVSVQSNEAEGVYRLRRGLVSLAPDLLPVSACPGSLSENPLPRNATAAIAFLHETQGQLSTLRELRKNNCHFEAWLRFARAPALSDTEASDLRFASGLRGNFTTLSFEAFRHRECARHVPRWGFPRADLLASPAR
jgi:inner membrane protein